VTRAQLLAVVAGWLIALALVLSFTEVSATAGDGTSIRCGDVLLPNSVGVAVARATAAFDGGDPTDYQSSCDNAMSDRRTLTYGATALGILVAVAAVVASEPRRHTADNQHQQHNQ
jgi:hypothetical protein